MLSAPRSIHHVPQRFAEQRPAAGLGTLHAHVEQTFLRVERGVRVHDHAVVARVGRVAPRRDQRVVGRRRLVREDVDRRPRELPGPDRPRRRIGWVPVAAVVLAVLLLVGIAYAATHSDNGTDQTTASNGTRSTPTALA